MYQFRISVRGPQTGRYLMVDRRKPAHPEQDPSMRSSCTDRIMHRRRSGQSLIVAVIVMFVLLFIGGIFVGLVARNLLNSGRARDTVEAAQFAEAGIQYADTQLRTSAEGADWRPAVVPAANIDPNDPDRAWLTQG